MNRLVEEFFKRDLTEGESQALEELLEKSSGDALGFGEKLRGEYLALGLPDPQTLSPSASSVPHSLTWIKAVLLTAVFAGLGTTAWWFWSKPAVVSLAPFMIPQTVSRPKVKLLPPPITIPERLVSTAEGNRLSVVVELENSSSVQVSILDPHNQTIRALFTGSLKPGKWSLHWDGLLDNGSKAPAGNYRIQVKSGSTEMSKTVSIE